MGSLNYVVLATKQIIINLVVKPDLIIDGIGEPTIEDAVTPTICTYGKREEED
jgi:hypothetical protein